VHHFGGRCQQEKVNQLLIADHPTLAVQIAHTVRVDPSARPVEGPFFKATTYNVFAPTYPVRITILVETASICNLHDKAATIWVA
jgi:hypothetical protein